MKHLRGFNETISYSGKDVTKMPVIGKLMSKPIEHFDGAEYNVVEIIELEDDKKIYVCDFWYKRNTPQIIHSDMVEKYTPIINENKVHPQEMMVGHQYQITHPCYDDYDEGLKPEVDNIEVVKRWGDNLIIKDIDNGHTRQTRFGMLDDCEIKEIR